jgi:lipoprotein signal peptidase
MPNTQAKKACFNFIRTIYWLGLSVLAIVLDQWTKWIASTHLNYADPVPVLPFLNWTLLHNYGAAFSFYLMLVAGNVIFYLFSRLCLDHFYFLVDAYAKENDHPYRWRLH